jgi:hypothetical protein
VTDEKPLDEQIMVALALAHLSMLSQAAKGDFRMLPDDVEARQAWLVGFIQTGQGIADESNRQLASQINEFLSTQSGMLSTQPDAA